MAVGAWKSKKTAEGLAEDSVEVGNLVTEQPVPMAAPAATLGSQQQGSEVMQVEGESSNDAVAAAAALATRVNSMEVGQWQTKKRAGKETVDGGAALPVATAAALEQQKQQQERSDIATAEASTSGAGTDLDSPAAGTPSALLSFSGLAYLAILPNASVTGHVMVDSDDPYCCRRSFGLVGEQVISRRECTRDEGECPGAAICLHACAANTAVHSLIMHPCLPISP